MDDDMSDVRGGRGNGNHVGRKGRGRTKLGAHLIVGKCLHQPLANDCLDGKVAHGHGAQILLPEGALLHLGAERGRHAAASLGGVRHGEAGRLHLLLSRHPQGGAR